MAYDFDQHWFPVWQEQTDNGVQTFQRRTHFLDAGGVDAAVNREERRKKKEERRKKTEDRRTKNKEDRRQKTEDRRQKTEDRRKNNKEVLECVHCVKHVVVDVPSSTVDGMFQCFAGALFLCNME